VRQKRRADSSDQATLAKIAKGETSAVADLYDRYVNLVFTLIIRIVQNHALAEDLTQEVFLRVWRSALTYRAEVGTVKSWLLAIAHHCAVDELRRRRKEQNWISMDEIDPDVFCIVEDDLNDPLVYQALQSLPDEQREVIDLAYFHGLTVMDIATRQSIPIGTVKSRIRLALEKMRAYLGIEKDSRQ
jgi:RNA polymerase sigma-70 factor (ECF subfamily)